MSKRISKTRRGVPVDFEAFRMKNEKEIAVGNAGLNARGDKIGKGGKIVEKVNERAARYQHEQKSVTKTASLKKEVSKEELAQMAEVEVKEVKKRARKKEVKLQNGDIEWVDEDQNPDPELD